MVPALRGGRQYREKHVFYFNKAVDLELELLDRDVKAMLDGRPDDEAARALKRVRALISQRRERLRKAADLPEWAVKRYA